MKRILLNFLFFTSLCLSAQEVRKVEDLRQNDAFDLRITIPAANTKLNLVWDFGSGQKVDVEFQVLEVNDGVIQLSIKPKRWFINYQSPQDENVVFYFDSDYSLFGDNKKLFYKFENHSVTASIDLNNNAVKLNFATIPNEQDAWRSRTEWYIQPIEIPKGLRIEPFENTLPDLMLNFKDIIQITLNDFVKVWKERNKEGLSIPDMIDLRKEYNSKSNSPAFIQLISASFDINPNTSIFFTAPKDMPEDRVFIQMGNKRIAPQKGQNNNYRFNFFLSSPKRVYIQDLILDLTPADSINVKYDTSAKAYKIEGRGAANSSYINTISTLYQNEESTKNTILTEVLKKGEEFYKSTLNNYSSDMNDYWLKSAKLSQDYWCVAEQFKSFNKTTKENWMHKAPSVSEIPWTESHFKNIFPFSDYLYQPYTYGEFVNNFFNYKAQETNNSVMTGIKYLQSSIPQYYFSDAILWGYPRSYMTSEALKYLMINFQLDESRREYDDFLSKLHDPEIRESVVNLHNQLTKIEPGANIKDLKLDVEKYIPFKKDVDKYIILLVGDEKIGFNPNLGDYETNIKEIYKNLKDDLQKNNLTDKVDICIITSEAGKALLKDAPEIQKELIFVPDKEIRDYTDKVVSRDRAFIVLRSNGEILNRYHPSEYKSSISFLIWLIQGDIVKQKNQDSASSGVLTIIITILISTLITFFLVRYIIIRRERIKRHIQELELKAIRAQINPHFTFNALGSIQNLISQKKDQEANQYLVNFAKLLRMVLSTSEKKLVSLSDEIQLLDLYLQLEKLRVPFDYVINVDSKISSDNEEVPGMLIQPIVENAVKHGIASMGGGQIKIMFKMADKVLEVEVVDTGNGFSELDMNKNTEKGFGLKSVQDRLSLLNKELHLNISLKIENIKEGAVIKGAKVSLYIPV